MVSAVPKDRDEDDNGCTLEHYAEQITDVEAELKDFRTCLLDVDLVPEHPIMHTQHEIEGTFFRYSVAIRKRLHASTDTITRDMSTTRAPGAWLPKLEVPNFDGDILKWKPFWDQFSVLIHEPSDLVAAEKWSTYRTP